MPDFILSPLFWSLLLALLLGVAWHRVPRWLSVGMLVVELLLVASMAPVGANRLVRAVEWRGPLAPACTRDPPEVIVLLSGGTERPARATDDFSALTRASVDRLFTAVALWQAHPASKLVISGGGMRGGVAESRVLAELAGRMGVPVDRVRLDTRSRTTWENARDAAGARPSLARRIWLVTSALHLPRALTAFHDFGFEVCPVASGSVYVPFSASLGYFVPQTSALIKTDAAIHELLGGWVYAWRARGLAVDRESGGAPPDASAR